jgi:hypothetical protein
MPKKAKPKMEIPKQEWSERDLQIWKMPGEGY